MKGFRLFKLMWILWKSVIYGHRARIRLGSCNFQLTFWQLRMYLINTLTDLDLVIFSYFSRVLIHFCSKGIIWADRQTCLCFWGLIWEVPSEVLQCLFLSQTSSEEQTWLPEVIQSAKSTQICIEIKSEFFLLDPRLFSLAGRDVVALPGALCNVYNTFGAVSALFSMAAFTPRR